MQPLTTSGAVANPNSSAPRIAPITTSRPVLICPSTWTAIRPRKRLRTNVCCVSARPSSQGVPACLIDDQGEAPVPPSRSEEHTSELQSHSDLVCRLLLEKKKVR